MFKYIKRLFGKRNSAGFTLVEVVVSMALLGVLLVGVFGFVAPLLANVVEKQQDARAVMLMEAVDSYITNSLRNAKYVKIIANVNPYNLPDSSNADWTQAKDDLKAMASAVTGSGGEDEMHCISFRWLPTGIYDEYKMVLVQENVKVTGGSITVDKTLSKEVMGDAIYDKLYIVPRFEMIDNNIPDSSNPSGFKYGAGDPELHNVGIANVTRVFKSPDCYSTSASNRRSSHIAYEGQSFNSLATISSQFVNKFDNTSKEYKYKAYDMYDAFTYTDGVATGGYDTTGANSVIWNDDSGSPHYYPETYIFYVSRDLGKFTT